MDAKTPDRSKKTTAKGPEPEGNDLLSHHVRPAELEWKKTRFPGCEAKTLLFDKETGLVTALMRFAPGATIPLAMLRAAGLV